MGKRNEVMIVEDRARVCELLARGHRNKVEMARILNENRPEELHISPQQIGKDIKAMQDAYLEKGFENLEVYRHQAMQELLYLIKVSFDSFEQSKGKKITVESTKGIESQEDYDQLLEDGVVDQEEFEEFNGFGREGKIKEEIIKGGNPAFLNTIKSCFDSLNKIRGVDGTTKVALTDPSGTEQYTGIADVMKARLDELAGRHAPEDTRKLLLDAMPDDSDAIDVEAEDVND